jgi:hypothetical protein
MAQERANRLVKELGPRRMVRAEANGEPGKTVRLRMQRHSGVTGQQSDGPDSVSSDDEVESEAGRTTVETGGRTRKRLLGGKLDLQLSKEAWGDGQLTVAGQDDETGAAGGQGAAKRAKQSDSRAQQDEERRPDITRARGADQTNAIQKLWRRGGPERGEASRGRSDLSDEEQGDSRSEDIGQMGGQVSGKAGDSVSGAGHSVTGSTIVEGSEGSRAGEVEGSRAGEVEGSRAGEVEGSRSGEVEGSRVSGVEGGSGGAGAAKKRTIKIKGPKVGGATGQATRRPERKKKGN